MAEYGDLFIKFHNHWNGNSYMTHILQGKIRPICWIMYSGLFFHIIEGL